MPTGPVFRAFDAANPHPPIPKRLNLGIRSYYDVARLMEKSRNDLEPIAIRLGFVIQTVIDRLASRPGALAARMSGSGATVFGLFSSAAAARRAAGAMAGRGWWAMSAQICASGRLPSKWCSR
jgi:4-diphosphocytidyl-2-C-methyl-D-erythritol kinase